MSKQTIALIIILSLITIVLLIVAFATPFQQKKTVTSNTPSVVPTITPFPAHTLIWLVFPTTPSGTVLTSLRKGQSYAMNGYVDTQVDKITGVQIELAYDPKVITSVSVTPGTFITDPFVVLNKINTVDGRISYAIAIKPGGQMQQGKGIFGMIHFTVAPTATATTATFTFLPKTVVTTESTSDTVLKQFTNLSMPITP